MRTLVLGASPNPARYSHLATQRLVEAGHEVVLVGIREGNIADQPIYTVEAADVTDVHTLTLYVGAARQPAYYDWILEQVKPERIIFNPGTENPELQQRATAEGIACEHACTLVMLASGEYEN